MTVTDCEVKKIYMTSKEWLKEIPQLIKKLKLDYNFEYFRPSETFGYISLRKPATAVEVALRGKDRYAHRIVLYRTCSNRFWLMVFSKKNPTVYICEEYLDRNWNRVRRFLNKFENAYNEAVKELAERTSAVNNHGEEVFKKQRAVHNSGGDEQASQVC